MAAGVGRSGASSRESAQLAAKVRRQKIIVGAGGVLLVALLAIQGPGTLKKLSGGSSAQPPLPPAAIAHTKPAVAVRASRVAATPARLRRFAATNLFVPQVAATAATTGNPTTGMSIASGPKVRTKNFVVKDPFDPQIEMPTGAVAATAVMSTVAQGEASVSSPSTDTGTYTVVIASVPAARGPEAGARAVRTAQNSGLKDVFLTPPANGRKGHFTISTGPYSSSAANRELIRALRNGYPNAYIRKLSSTPGGGF